MKPYERRLYLPVILSVICLRERDEWTEIIGKLFPQAFHLTSEIRDNLRDKDYKLYEGLSISYPNRNLDYYQKDTADANNQ